MSLVRVDDVTHRYRLGLADVIALDGVNLRVGAGEFVAITGMSGSGKSTLLHLVAGLMRPTSGRIVVNGQDLSSLSEEQLALFRRRHVGYVFQSFRLLPQLTALENVELPLAIAGVAPEMRRTQALQVLEKVGLADRAAHRPWQLSGGQQQRVSIARALVTGPVLVLADEPTGNLDSRTGGEILDLLEEVNRKDSVTLMVVTHSREVATRADRVVEMRDGRVLGVTLRTSQSDSSPAVPPGRAPE